MTPSFTDHGPAPLRTRARRLRIRAFRGTSAGGRLPLEIRAQLREIRHGERSAPQQHGSFGQHEAEAGIQVRAKEGIEQYRYDGEPERERARPSLEQQQANRCDESHDENNESQQTHGDVDVGRLLDRIGLIRVVDLRGHEIRKYEIDEAAGDCENQSGDDDGAKDRDEALHGSKCKDYAIPRLARSLRSHRRTRKRRPAATCGRTIPSRKPATTHPRDSGESRGFAVSNPLGAVTCRSRKSWPRRAAFSRWRASSVSARAKPRAARQRWRRRFSAGSRKARRRNRPDWRASGDCSGSSAAEISSMTCSRRDPRT